MCAIYTEARIIERLEKAKQVLGWVPERHSIDEVRHFIGQMAKLEFSDPKTPTVIRVDESAVTPMQRNFMRNEIQMCACDADYFLTRYAWIKDPSNTPMQFAWRNSQRIYFRQLQWLEQEKYSQEMMLLKARQQYMTTIVLLLMTHRITFGYGTNAVSASCDKTKSEEIAARIFFCLDNLPWWLKPTQAKRQEGKHIAFENQCSFTVQSGNQMSGIARGSTPTCVHLSEVADFPDPQTLIEASLFRAVHPHPKVFLMLESTGNSNVGWWAETWRKSKADWAVGKARLCPMFIPWWVNTELYPTPTWMHMHPIPRDWRPMEETIAHMVKCKAYCANTEYLRREFGSTWTLPIPQAWFWEINYQEHKAKKIEREWLQEMPADDYEALQSRQEKVFPYEVLTRMENQRQKDYDVYAVIGEGIEEKFYPLDTDIDYTRPRIIIGWSHQGKTYRWQLVPLHLNNVEDPDAMQWNNKLLVYEHPVEGKRYSVGIDTAGGGGGDRTVFSVNRSERGPEPDVQAAELASDAISAAESYAFAMAVCVWYDAAMIACEQIRKPGDICQLQMRQMGWPNGKVHSFVRYDGKRVQKGKSHKKGWYTTGWSRPLLLAMFIAAVENGWYRANSVFLKQECDNFEARYTDSGITKMEHAQGKYDDRLFAAAISYFIDHDLQMMIERSKRRYAAPSGKLPELNLAPCVLGAVPFQQIWGNRYPGSGARR